uniref:Uncharacterized protein n=1 Tax=Arundo donax TaxID=35708 RepID=A0A0A8Z488_ARUDO
MFTVSAQCTVQLHPESERTITFFFFRVALTCVQVEQSARKGQQISFTNQ